MREIKIQPLDKEEEEACPMLISDASWDDYPCCKENLTFSVSPFIHTYS